MGKQNSSGTFNYIISITTLLVWKETAVNFGQQDLFVQMYIKSKQAFKRLIWCNQSVKQTPQGTKTKFETFYWAHR